jgi:hypothetical protein
MNKRTSKETNSRFTSDEGSDETENKYSKIIEEMQKALEAERKMREEKDKELEELKRRYNIV